MVRLKVNYNDSGNLCAKDFNSSMVRLKAIKALIFVVLLANFNSSMVRLKELKFK